MISKRGKDKEELKITAIYNSVTELISKTPIVKLDKTVPEDPADIFIKLEFFNPGGSIRDRIALSMIKKVEHDGLLKPSDTIIGPISRNTGIGLSMAGVVRGYKATIVMPGTMSVERRLLMKGYGAELILTPDADGISGPIRETECLIRENGYFLSLRFENEVNPLVHEKTTSPEIHQAFGVNGLDAFVVGIGIGGTTTGAGRGLKRVYPKIESIGVEPTESAILERKEAGPYKIQGIGTGFVPKIPDTSMYGKVLLTSGDEAVEAAREVGRKEGILAGILSGAAIAATLKAAKELRKDKKVLAMAPDNDKRCLFIALCQEI